MTKVISSGYEEEHIEFNGQYLFKLPEITQKDYPVIRYVVYFIVMVIVVLLVLLVRYLVSKRKESNQSYSKK